MQFRSWDDVTVDDYTAVGTTVRALGLLELLDAELSAFGLQIVFCGSITPDRVGWFKVEKVNKEIGEKLERVHQMIEDELPDGGG